MHFEASLTYGNVARGCDLPGYLAVIKVDGLGLPLPVGPLVLARGKPLFIGVRDMRKGAELPFVQQIFGNYIRRASARDKRGP